VGALDKQIRDGHSPSNPDNSAGGLRRKNGSEAKDSGTETVGDAPRGANARLAQRLLLVRNFLR
jgi:hypothetical protein